MEYSTLLSLWNGPILWPDSSGKSHKYAYIKNCLLSPKCMHFWVAGMEWYGCRYELDMDVELQRGSSNDQWWRGTAIE